MRINKLLSNYGICSRTDVNRLIDEKRIMVNGKLCTTGQWVEKEDNILLDNENIVVREKIYIALNKPVGITCTAEKTVENNIINFMNYPEYIFPVGRLDKASQGLILMTNDGDLANNILESENEHEKEYIVTVNKHFDESFLKAMSEGVQICGVKTRHCKVIAVSDDTFRIILTQGLNKQIRRMSKTFGYTVVRLERVRIINIKIDETDIGMWRYLTEKEVIELRNS
ncbi:pseudouridine synthase [Clostridium sp. CM028]|uniref:pseudouridine synthase n=1 Tax=unclassified Clostridium TaxID=2614128 RepID=UPI001C0BBB18|nr:MULTISPECIES: pseudouridine synthase [unclassified Clostridium]MBU3092540.1 pseudouridine synthase [Clostridium sp. CF011]MBW9146343.1 pseudouridine synthase [Clostridium sp. CM027]MBW9150056.1 pseudouridine synthase [Clostridium sp. CM028]UVE39856.1 pseudouridine synthase [Clostridium sp. CM027]WAG68771.1 pseudouridine synthase [Clostridium sp. CF011]